MSSFFVNKVPFVSHFVFALLNHFCQCSFNDVFLVWTGQPLYQRITFFTVGNELPARYESIYKKVLAVNFNKFCCFQIQRRQTFFCWDQYNSVKPDTQSPLIRENWLTQSASQPLLFDKPLSPSYLRRKLSFSSSVYKYKFISPSVLLSFCLSFCYFYENELFSGMIIFVQYLFKEYLQNGLQNLISLKFEFYFLSEFVIAI